MFLIIFHTFVHLRSLILIDFQHSNHFPLYSFCIMSIVSSSVWLHYCLFEVHTFYNETMFCFSFNHFSLPIEVNLSQKNFPYVSNHRSRILFDAVDLCTTILPFVENLSKKFFCILREIFV